MKSSDISLGLGLEHAGLLALKFPRAAATIILALLAISVYGLTQLSFDENLRQVFRGVWPFVIAELIILALLIAFPSIALWLPTQMR